MDNSKSKLHIYLENIHASVDTFLQITETVVSGSIPAICSNILLQPFDTIKTRQQVFHGRFKDTFKSINYRDGMIGFWRGIGPTLWKIIPSSIIYFYMLDRLNYTIKSVYYPSYEKLPVHLTLLTSALSRSISCISVMPFTVVKTQFEGLGNVRPYTSTLDAINKIYCKYGLKGIFSGTIPTLLRDVPHAALYYGFYTQIRFNLLKRYEHDLQNEYNQIGIYLISGACSGFLATLITHPFDVIKTKLQYDLENQYKTIREVVIKTMKEDRFLKRGFGARILRRSLSTGFVWLMYEQIVEMTNPTSHKIY